MKRFNKSMSRTIAVVMVVVMALALFAGCGGKNTIDPKAEIKAAVKTLGADFSKMNDQFVSDEMKELNASGSFYEEMALSLKSADLPIDISDFYGTGFYLGADANLDERRMLMDIGINVGTYDLLTLNTVFDDAMLYMACYELLGDTYFGINTETMAEDLDIDSEGLGLSYNLFDIVEDMIDESGEATLAPATMKALSEHVSALSDASTYADGGETAIDCNDTEVKCATYTMTIPYEALSTFIVDSFRTLTEDEYCKLMLEAALVEELYYYDSYEELIDEIIVDLEDELEDSELDDIEMAFYVEGKILRGIDFTLTDGDDGFDVSIRFGAGDNYLDYFEFIFSDMNDAENYIIVTSEGNHTMADGLFTDETAMLMNSAEDGEMLSFVMITEYDTNDGAYAFDISMDVDGESIAMYAEGAVETEGNEMTMYFDDFTVEYAGMSVSFEGYIYVGESMGAEIDDVDDAVMIADLTEQDIYELSALIEENTYIMLMELMEEVPAIADLLMG